MKTELSKWLKGLPKKQKGLSWLAVYFTVVTFNEI